MNESLPCAGVDFKIVLIMGFLVFYVGYIMGCQRTQPDESERLGLLQQLQKLRVEVATLKKKVGKDKE